MAAVETCCLASLLRCAQRSLELRFIFVRQRGFQDRAARALQLVEHLVRRGLPHQHEQRGAARLHRSRQVLHELVVDADIREGAGHRPGSGAHCHAEQRIQEDQSDQRPPEAAADGAGCRHVHGLMEDHLPLLILDSDHRVFQIDQVVLLHFHERQANLVGLELIVVPDDRKCAHAFLLSCRVVSVRPSLANASSSTSLQLDAYRRNPPPHPPPPKPPPPHRLPSPASPPPNPPRPQPPLPRSQPPNPSPLLSALRSKPPPQLLEPHELPAERWSPAHRPFCSALSHWDRSASLTLLQEPLP